MDADEVRPRIGDAFRVLGQDYGARGGWRFPGYLDEPTSAYVGPWAWSEADIQRRLANALANEFPPEWIHLEFQIRSGTRVDAPPPPPGKKRAPTTHIDIVISDATRLPDDLRNASHDQIAEASLEFRSRTHEAFIEVKWFHQGSPAWDKHNWTAKVKNGLEPDGARLWIT